MQLLMKNNIPADIRWLIEAKLRLAGDLPPKFITFMPGCGKGNYARKRRARRISVACARMSCNKKSCSLGMVSDNREDKIQFIRDDLNKESMDDILLPLETHYSGYVQGAILQLWPLFQKEYARYSFRSLTINDLICQFIRKLDGNPRPIEGVQAVSGRKTRRRCEPQSQLLVNILLIHCYFISLLFYHLHYCL